MLRWYRPRFKTMIHVFLQLRPVTHFPSVRTAVCLVPGILLEAGARHRIAVRLPVAGVLPCKDSVAPRTKLILGLGVNALDVPVQICLAHERPPAIHVTTDVGLLSVHIVRLQVLLVVV
jgi:hypothetical protein